MNLSLDAPPAEALWLSVSPYLKGFNQRLLSQLTSARALRQWEYCQTLDEPCCVDAVVDALHDYVSNRARLEESTGNPNYKVHLLGHGVSGVVGLFYARRYPQHVASLTLLSVGPLPAVNWQAHYYVLRDHVPCSRERLLGQMTQLLFGKQSYRFAKALAILLRKDLDSNLTLHSLASRTQILPGGVSMPLLVCNGQDDVIVRSQKDIGKRTHHNIHWTDWMKPTDQLWECPEGNHFFHFHHASPAAETIKTFWAGLAEPSRSLAGKTLFALNRQKQAGKKQADQKQAGKKQAVKRRAIQDKPGQKRPRT